MAKPKPEKKREGKANGQLPLPSPGAPVPGSVTRVLPMDLKLGDRLIDETGEWEVIGRPYTTAGGKSARVRVQRVGEPAVTELRTWGAHERIAVRQAPTKE